MRWFRFMIPALAAVAMAGCMDAGGGNPGGGPFLDSLYVKETNRRDHWNQFCIPVLDAYDKPAYRNGDTLRIFFGRNTADCGRPALTHSYSGDSIRISAEWPLSPCVDTPLYSYVEAGYRIRREGATRFILSAGGSVAIDTLLITGEVTDPFPCDGS